MVAPIRASELESCTMFEKSPTNQVTPISSDLEDSTPFHISSRALWAASLGAWIFIALAGTLTIYQMYRMSGGKTELGTTAAMQFSQMLSYVPLTPFAFRLAIRYSIQRGNWIKTALIHLLGGLAFTCGHIVVRGFTPYGYWDSREWQFTFWDTHAHALRFPWQVLKRVYMANVVDDATFTYLPVVLIAHVMLYYHNSQQKELRATRLSEQLARAHLQVLKNQLQPHFLFNTLHSISALMLTNAAAADRMMTSLSDLLRMSLEDKGNQLTTLKRDLEFLSVYVDIEKARFEDKLRVVFDIEPQCLDAQVPHLFLQPLVENAVRHGTSQLSRPGEVDVVAKRRGEKLEIWIQDNGPGFIGPSEDLFLRGLGLGVTRERLEALYGGEQEFHIYNVESGGVKVEVRLPFHFAPDPGESDRVEHEYM